MLATVPAGLAYLVVGAGAAVENIFPPVPSDTFVLIGGVLADRGVLDPFIALAVAWTANVLGALFVYAICRKHGSAIFRTRWGRWLLRPHQMERLANFYGRYGLFAIFWSRFLPVLRVIVPAFAGIAGLGFWSTAAPLALASAMWYGVVLYAGILASRNLHRILELAGQVNDWLLVAALLAMAAILFWWWRSRRERADAESAE